MSSILFSINENTPLNQTGWERLDSNEDKERLHQEVENNRKKKEKDELEVRIEKDGVRLHTETGIAKKLIQSYPDPIRDLIERCQQLKDEDRRKRLDTDQSSHTKHFRHRKRKLEAHDANLKPLPSSSSSGSSPLESVSPPEELKFGLRGRVIIRMHRFTSSAVEELDEEDYEARKIDSSSANSSVSPTATTPSSTATISTDPRKKRRKLAVIPEGANTNSTSPSNEQGQPQRLTASSLLFSSLNSAPAPVPQPPKKRGRKSNAQKREEEAERTRLEREKAIAEGRNPDTINLRSRKRGLDPKDYRDLIFVCILTTKDDEDEDLLEELSRWGKNEWHDWRRGKDKSKGGTGSSLLDHAMIRTQHITDGPPPPTPTFSYQPNQANQQRFWGPAPSNPSSSASGHPWFHPVPNGFRPNTTQYFNPSVPKTNHPTPPQTKIDDSLPLLAQLPHLTDVFTRTSTVAFHRNIVFPQLTHVPSWLKFEDIDSTPSTSQSVLTASAGYSLGGSSGLANHPFNSISSAEPRSNNQSLTWWDPAMKLGAFPLYLLPVPSILEFKALLSFLYTHDFKRLEEYLLPDRPNPLRRHDIQPGQPLDTLQLQRSPEQWRGTDWQDHDFEGLDEDLRIKHVKRIKRFYATAKWLTVRNKDMWKLVSRAWYLIRPKGVKCDGPPSSRDSNGRSYSSGRGFKQPELYNRIEINFWNRALEESESQRRKADPSTSNQRSPIEIGLDSQAEMHLERKRRQEEDSALLSSAMERLLQTRHQRELRKQAPPHPSRGSTVGNLESAQNQSTHLLQSGTTNTFAPNTSMDVNVATPPQVLPTGCLQLSTLDGSYWGPSPDTAPRHPPPPASTGDLDLPVFHSSYNEPNLSVLEPPLAMDTQPPMISYQAPLSRAFVSNPESAMPRTGIAAPSAPPLPYTNPSSDPFLFPAPGEDHEDDEPAQLNTNTPEGPGRFGLENFHGNQGLSSHDVHGIGSVWPGNTNLSDRNLTTHGLFDSSASQPFDLSALSQATQAWVDTHSFNNGFFWPDGNEIYQTAGMDEQGN